MVGSFCKAMSLPLCTCYYCGQNLRTKEHSLLIVYDLTCTEHKVPVEIELEQCPGCFRGPGFRGMQVKVSVTSLEAS
jgi:hypothetical protein